MANVKWAAVAAIAVVLVALAILWEELPAWRWDGTRTIAAASVSSGLDTLDCPVAGSRIAIYGDSHVIGGRMGPQVPEGRTSFGAILANALPGDIGVALNGVGGHTAAMGEQRWNADRAQADFVIVAYGTNDAAPRGWLRDKRPVPLGDFKASLNRMIHHFDESDSRVVLLAPPPGGSRAIAERLAPYRHAVEAVGIARGLAVFDPADAFAQCAGSQPLLVRDALHMNAGGHRCLGQWIARQMCPGIAAD